MRSRLAACASATQLSFRRGSGWPRHGIPRWGRVEETYGEDPILIGTIGVAYVRGLQTSDLRNGVVATGKHFLGYAMSEGGRNWNPVQLGPRELREVYAEPFAAAIRDAK